MRLFKQTAILFKKNKRLWLIILGYMGINFFLIYRRAGMALGTEITLLEPTRQILFLCPQVLILYLIVGYEFFSESYRNHLDEAILATSKGYRGHSSAMNFILMITVLFVNYMVFLGFDIGVTFRSFNFHGITDSDHMAVTYISMCLFVNIFLLGLIGIFIALVISRIRKRIAAYAVIMAVVLCTSYLLNEIADLIMIMTDYAVNLYSILDIINVMTPGLKFVSNTALGFPMMTYRISLICFWIAVLALIAFLQHEKRLSLKSGICVILCVLTFIGYALPSSRVDMGLSSSGTAMADQHYYGVNQYRIEEKKRDFNVKRYVMELDVRRLLKAKVQIETSKVLNKYHFTLSHSYNVESVNDENGQKMEFSRNGDALLIDNEKSKTKVFTVVYSGSNEAYYANSQGINLRGSFPYYPVPGYKQISFDGFNMCQLFLDEEAQFDIRIKSRKKIFSNLETDGHGHFFGRSEGATLLSGLYTEKIVKGVRIVYPPFIGWGPEDLESVADGVIRDHYENRQIFITPNVNRQDDAVGKEQIITRNYFTSVDEDLFPYTGE